MSDTNLTMKSQQSTAAQNFDPTLLEYCGSDGLPMQLWQPLVYEGRKDFHEAIGIEREEDHNGESQAILEETDKINFVVWSSFIFKSKAMEHVESGEVQKNMAD